MDSPIMAEFAANLERINAVADHSPGFVWRLQTEEGDATSIRPFEDENLLVNRRFRLLMQFDRARCPDRLYGISNNASLASN